MSRCFVLANQKTLIKLYVMGGGGWGGGGGEALPLYRKGMRTRDFGPSENQLVPGKVEIRAGPTLDNN